MTSFIIPFVVLFIIIYGLKKKVNIYDSFLSGVGEGLELSYCSKLESDQYSQVRK